jgi:hypothetical protein
MYRVAAGSSPGQRAPMRPLLAAIALIAAACAPARAADLRLARVWPQWHNADSFASLYEDHTGRELVGGWIVLRSQPDQRGGLYFLARVENPGAQVPGATFVLRVISPGSIDTRVFRFSADIPRGSKLFEIGLTGKDWAGARVQPVAWELEVQGADGSVMARKTSFLWEKPSG